MDPRTRRVTAPFSRTTPSSELRRLPAGAELVLGSQSTLLVLCGSVTVRLAGGKVERLAAGTLVLPSERTPVADARVLRALAILQAAPDRRWTVERLARTVGLSRAAFARRFAAAVGCSPLRHLTELRLSRAAARLETSDALLAEIAAEVGYASEFAFSRAFKRRYGVSPGRFRRAPTAGVACALAA